MKTKMKIGFLGLLMLVCGDAFNQDKGSDIDRGAFYHAMQSQKLDIIDTELNALKSLNAASKSAFEGALTMKKAALASSPSKKLNLFKSGHKQLEGAIKQDTSNTEFRFLRLMIQEHAPDILGYKKELKMDCEYIRKTYKNLSQSIQDAIIEYSKKSKVLKLQDI